MTNRQPSSGLSCGQSPTGPDAARVKGSCNSARPLLSRIRAWLREVKRRRAMDAADAIYETGKRSKVNLMDRDWS